MKALVAGASGFIGSALVESLRTDGWTVRRLVRAPARQPDEVRWDPSCRVLPADALRDIAAIINLAGENVGAGRWTDARKRTILDSRIAATETLAQAVRCLAPGSALVNASAVGYYGSRGDQALNEAAARGEGFLADVCAAWEGAAERAASFGARVVCLRFGLVLGPGGGALARMLPVFRLGLGGRLGDGEQWMSWIQRDDACRVVARALADSTISGALNVVAPGPVRNAELVRTLGKALRRPAFVPTPAAALRLAFGEMAEQTLLASTRAVPARLQQLGFEWRYPHLSAALDASLRPSDPSPGGSAPSP